MRWVVFGALGFAAGWVFATVVFVIAAGRILR